MSNNICYETWLNEVSPLYYCISPKVSCRWIISSGEGVPSLVYNRDDSRTRASVWCDSTQKTIWQSFITIAVLWHTTEMRTKMPQDALHESDRRMQVKSWLRKWIYCIIRRSTKRGGSFILNYGGNKPHSSDINFDNGKTYHLGEQRRIVGYNDDKKKNILPQNFKV